MLNVILTEELIMTDDNNDALPLLQRVEISRRDSLRKLLVTTAYSVPAVASFTLAGMSVAEAQNYGGNG